MEDRGSAYVELQHFPASLGGHVWLKIEQKGEPVVVIQLTEEDLGLLIATKFANVTNLWVKDFE